MEFRAHHASIMDLRERCRRYWLVLSGEVVLLQQQMRDGVLRLQVIQRPKEQVRSNAVQTVQEIIVKSTQ